MCTKHTSVCMRMYGAISALAAVTLQAVTLQPLKDPGWSCRLDPRSPLCIPLRASSWTGSMPFWGFVGLFGARIVLSQIK